MDKSNVLVNIQANLKNIQSSKNLISLTLKKGQRMILVNASSNAGKEHDNNGRIRKNNNIVRKNPVLIPGTST